MRAFDRSKLTPEVQQKLAAKLDHLEANAITHLQDPKYRWETACHEGAHGVYHQRAGAVKSNFLPGYFVYDAEKGELIVAACAISGEWPPHVKNLNFRDVARYCVAGYTWEEHITGATNVELGATLDKRTFEEKFHRFHPGAPNEEIQSYWDKAEAEVRADLGNIEIRNQIEKLAHDFEAFLLAEEPPANTVSNLISTQGNTTQEVV
jgi:hypothetical protein